MLVSPTSWTARGTMPTTVYCSPSRGGQTDFVDGIYASGRYFDALGVKAILGRTFTAEDDRRDGGPNGPVAVISYALWQRRFGETTSVIGRAQTIESVPFTIVGVMPPAFFGTDVGTRATSLFRSRPSA